MPQQPSKELERVLTRAQICFDDWPCHERNKHRQLQRGRADIDSMFFCLIMDLYRRFFALFDAYDLTDGPSDEEFTAGMKADLMRIDEMIDDCREEEEVDWDALAPVIWEITRARHAAVVDRYRQLLERLSNA